jgi:pyruvate-formate lyase-activating enzyme
MDRPVCIDCKLHCVFCSNASVLGYAGQVSKKLIHYELYVQDAFSYGTTVHVEQSAESRVAVITPISCS